MTLSPQAMLTTGGVPKVHWTDASAAATERTANECQRGWGAVQTPSQLLRGTDVRHRRAGHAHSGSFIIISTSSTELLLSGVLQLHWNSHTCHDWQANLWRPRQPTGPEQPPAVTSEPEEHSASGKVSETERLSGYVEVKEHELAGRHLRRQVTTAINASLVRIVCILKGDGDGDPSEPTASASSVTWDPDRAANTNQ